MAQRARRRAAALPALPRLLFLQQPLLRPRVARVALAEVAVEILGPIGTEMQRLMADPGYVDGVLRDGAERAAAMAEPILREVQEIVGFLRS